MVRIIRSYKLIVINGLLKKDCYKIKLPAMICKQYLLLNHTLIHC